MQRSEGDVELPSLLLFKRSSVTLNVVLKTVQSKKEALALMLALRHFDVYLSANPFPVRVYTDHNPLVFLSRYAKFKPTFECAGLGHSRV